MNIHYANYSVDYFLDSMASAGFQTLAFWGGPPHFHLDHRSFDSCSSLLKKAHARGLTIECFTAPGCTYGYQVGMPEPFRENSFNYFLNGIRVCNELGCQQMTINSGWGLQDEDREESWKRSRDMLYRLADAAQSYGVTLTMESLRRAETQLVYTLGDTKRMYDEVGHPNLKVMVDTTAMGVANETLDQWFSCFDTSIENLHFVDGTPHGHLAWGDGCQPLEQFIQCLEAQNYQGLLGLEITHSRYFSNPKEADFKNMQALSKYCSD
jgi:protein FrlC